MFIKNGRHAQPSKWRDVMIGIYTAQLSAACHLSGICITCAGLVQHYLYRFSISRACLDLQIYAYITLDHLSYSVSVCCAARAVP